MQILQKIICMKSKISKGKIHIEVVEEKRNIRENDKIIHRTMHVYCECKAKYSVLYVKI